MKTIVAIDKNWGIGARGKMLFNIKKDLTHFRETTTGGVVVMGRSTLLALPEQKPLPNRFNIVLSHYTQLKIDGAVVTTVEDLPEILKKYKETNIDVFIMGGGSVYSQTLKYCSEAFVTKVDYEFPLVDTFFPDIDKMPNWELVSESETFSEDRYKFKFCKYKNNAVLDFFAE